MNKHHSPQFCGFLLALLIPLFSTAAPNNTHDNSQAQYRAFFTQNAIPVKKTNDLAPLYNAIGERRFVLLGESTHGTHEYYRWRSDISRHLITQKNFRFVAVEGDWQAIYRLNNYVKWRTPEELDARTLMRTQLTRWPQWMWANEEFADFIEWLRDYNKERPATTQVGVFGLDMQDPEDSMQQVLAWFQQHDADNYPQVAQAYQQILDFPDNFRGYAQHLMRGGQRLDERLAIAVGLLQDRLGDNPAEADKNLWAIKQNALAVKRAEAQFHGATQPGPESWNARARFMHEAFNRLATRHGNQSRGIVWAHNTHIGDSSATDMGQRGEVNIGHLLRQGAGADQVFILGFATHQGTVVAGESWGSEQKIMDIIPAHPESYEGLMQRSGLKKHLLLFDEGVRNNQALRPMHQRAIGVIYRPPGEAYVPTLLAHRYDALFYMENTRALTPLSPINTQNKVH